MGGGRWKAAEGGERVVEGGGREAEGLGKGGGRVAESVRGGGCQCRAACHSLTTRALMSRALRNAIMRGWVEGSAA